MPAFVILGGRKTAESDVVVYVIEGGEDKALTIGGGLSCGFRLILYTTIYNYYWTFSLHKGNTENPIVTCEVAYLNRPRHVGKVVEEAGSSNCDIWAIYQRD